MNDEEKHERFIDEVPILAPEQLSKEAKDFLLGTKYSNTGKKQLQAAVNNFIWFNLGALESGENARLQNLRKKALQKFGNKMRATYGDCFFWRGKADMGGRLGKKPSYSELIKNVGKICTSRRRQGYSAKDGDFWRAKNRRGWDDLLQDFNLEEAVHNLQLELEEGNGQQEERNELDYAVEEGDFIIES